MVKISYYTQYCFIQNIQIILFLRYVYVEFSAKILMLLTLNGFPTSNLLCFCYELYTYKSLMCN